MQGTVNQIVTKLISSNDLGYGHRRWHLSALESQAAVVHDQRGRCECDPGGYCHYL